MEHSNVSRFPTAPFPFSHVRRNRLILSLQFFRSTNSAVICFPQFTVFIIHFLASSSLPLPPPSPPPDSFPTFLIPQALVFSCPANNALSALPLHRIPSVHRLGTPCALEPAGMHVKSTPALRLLALRYAHGSNSSTFSELWCYESTVSTTLEKRLSLKITLNHSYHSNHCDFRFNCTPEQFETPPSLFQRVIKSVDFVLSPIGLAGTGIRRFGIELFRYAVESAWCSRMNYKLQKGQLVEI